MRTSRLVFTLVLVSALLSAGAAWAAPPQWPDTNPSFDAKVREVAVWIPSVEHEVPGILTLPKAGGRAHSYAAVLMLHGFASQKDEVGDMYRREARALAERGVASLRIDFVGTGDSTRPYVDNTWTNMLDDALAAYDWLEAHPRIIDGQVGVLGFSMGGKVALGVVAQRPDAAALATWSGALADGLPAGYEALYPQAVADGSVVVDLGFTVVELGLDWFETFMAATPLTDALAVYRGPALAVVGDLDVVVPPATSAQFIQMLDSDDKRLHTIEGADHIFGVLTGDQTLTNEVLAVTADWFGHRLDRHAPTRQPVGRSAR
jgi:uncharacterized protein